MINKLKGLVNQDKHLRDFIAGSLVSLFMKGLGISSGFLLIYIISNKLGADGVGTYTIFIQTLFLATSISSVGLNSSVVRYSAQFSEEGINNNHKLILRETFKIVLTATGILIILLLVNNFWIREFLPRELDNLLIFLIFLVLIPIFSIYHIMIELLRGLQKMLVSEFFRHVFLPGFTIMVIIFLGGEMNNTNQIIYVYSVAAFLGFFILLGSIKHMFREINSNSTRTLNRKSLLVTSIPMMVSQIGNAAQKSLPFYVILILLTDEDVGLFAVPLRFAALFSIILFVVNTVMGPKIARIYFNGKIEDLQKYVNQSVNISTITAFIPMVIMILFSEQILGLFGDEYVHQSTLMRILILAEFINIVSGSNGLILNMSGHEKIARNIMIVTVLLFVLLSVTLTFYFGLIGTGFSILLIQIFRNILTINVVSKKIGIKTFFRFNTMKIN